MRAEEVSSCADHCNLTMRGIKLPNKDGLFGKSDPFFTISRLREDEKWQQARVFPELGLFWVCVEALSFPVTLELFVHACVVIHAPYVWFCLFLVILG